MEPTAHEPFAQPSTASSMLCRLRGIRMFAGEAATRGLGDGIVKRFLATDPRLAEAITVAERVHGELVQNYGALVCMAEADLCEFLQEDYLSFYGPAASSPYVPLAAAGPWIVTAHGAVLHDSGGYGMLGLGHAPPQLTEALATPWVMANVMTPSFSQRRFSSRLTREIGHTRGGHSRDACPYTRFVCLNSGSEAVSMAARVSDIHANRQTVAGAPHHGQQIRTLSLEGSFHGRTARAARASHATAAIYQQHLASFRDRDTLDTVAPNDIDALGRVFERARRKGVFYEAMFIEPVLGEGQPGLSLTRAFYDRARELTAAHGTLLVVDSIQAGLRATGCLSVVDYPGFAGCAPPDMETYSKALNAGQYPLSVLALSPQAAELYVTGLYGNTMTTNPRALEVGCQVLDSITDGLRINIRQRGAQLAQRLEEVAARLPGSILGVQGTGLMVNAELDPLRHTVHGVDGIEERLRRAGIVMIHGGTNGLRFTPHFAITEAEIDLIADSVEAVLALDH